MFQAVHDLELVEVKARAAGVAVAQERRAQEFDLRDPAIEEELIAVGRSSFWWARPCVCCRHEHRRQN